VLAKRYVDETSLLRWGDAEPTKGETHLKREDSTKVERGLGGRQRGAGVKLKLQRRFLMQRYE